MIEVFKTNVVSKRDAQLILADCRSFFPAWKINFDLEDCDRILRIDPGNETVVTEQIKSILTKFGYSAELLNS